MSAGHYLTKRQQTLLVSMLEERALILQDIRRAENDLAELKRDKARLSYKQIMDKAGVCEYTVVRYREILLNNESLPETEG